MTASRTRFVAIVWLIAMAIFVAGAVAVVTWSGQRLDPVDIVWTLCITIGYTTVGAVIVVRRPDEPIGRVCLAAGLLLVTAFGLRGASLGIYQQPGPMPAIGALIAILANALMTLALMVSGGFLLVRYPSGRTRSPFATAADVATGVGIAALVVTIFVPGLTQFSWMVVSNPIGIPGLDPDLDELLSMVVLFSYTAAIALAVPAVIGRYRRSGSAVRAQIRWVAAAGAVPVLLFALMLVTNNDVFWGLWIFSTALMPLAIGIAILRYRLYEIDRIIGRTLAYAIVTAVLAGTVVGINLLLQFGIAGATGSDTLTVAVSTLVVAALFQPIRRRVQVPIDRRFNRAHLDAERVVASFARRTRDEVDLGLLRDTVVGVMTESVRPSVAGLWLRERRDVFSDRLGREAANGDVHDDARIGTTRAVAATP